MLRRTQWEGSFSRRHLALAVCFAVVPHVFAFGSGNNYWQTGLSASIFWILAGLAIFVAAAPPSASWSIFLPVAAGAQMVAVLMLHVAVAHPYRQPQALGTVDEVVTLGAKGAQLRLSHDYAAYVTGFRLLASGAGFTVKTPVIDLTGHSPGTLFSLGGRSIGQPWLLGGYPGSDNFAVRVLRNVPCDDLAAAWLLVEPKGPRKLTPTVLKKFAINVEQDFESVGVVSTPPGFGDYAASSVQQLLKPTRDIRSAAGECERMKASAR